MSTGWGTVAEHPALAARGELDASLDTLAGANLWSLSPAQLRELRVDLERVTARLAAATLAVTHELATTGAGVEVGATSAAGWLRGTCRIDPRAATREVKLAAALDGPLAATRAALGAGALSVEHATVIQRTIDQLPAASGQLRAEGEAWLIDQARRFDPQALSRLASHLRHVADPEGHPDGDHEHRSDLEATEAELHRNRGFSLTNRHDGARIPKGLLDPEAGALLDTALDAVSAPVPGADGTPDPRTPAQRRADGLLELIKLALGAPDMPEDGGQPVTLVVTVALSTLEGLLRDANLRTHNERDTPETDTDPERDRDRAEHHLPGTALDEHTLHNGRPRSPARPTGAGLAAELENGTAISAETARRLACDAYLIPAVLGAHSEVLDLGRLTRTPTRAIRRALVARDHGCAFPGCGRPPRWTHAHHIAHWTRDHGPTTLTNLVLLCGRHHRVIHHDGWTVRITNHGLPVFRPPKWIDPDQTEQPSHNTTRQHALNHIPSRT